MVNREQKIEYDNLNYKMKKLPSSWNSTCVPMDSEKKKIQNVGNCNNYEENSYLITVCYVVNKIMLDLWSAKGFNFPAFSLGKL